jgi:hypothetical protein
MAMTVSDTLPVDAGNQKLLALVDSSTGNFALLRAINKETISSLDYADLAVAMRPAEGQTIQTHDAVSVGTSESVGTEVTSGGYSKMAIFVDVGSGADIRVRVYGRLSTGGDNYLLSIIEDGQQAGTRQVYLVDIAMPYLAISLQALADSATCSCSVYLLP